jgi:hypothetical protein
MVSYCSFLGAATNMPRTDKVQRRHVSIAGAVPTLFDPAASRQGRTHSAREQVCRRKPTLEQLLFLRPEVRQNLKAQNLALFCQIAEGVDKQTWMFHLRRGDYSRWFREVIKDSRLADEAQRIERRQDLLPQHSRPLIGEMIHCRYTLPE